MEKFEIVEKEYRTIFFIALAMVNSLWIYGILVQFVIQPSQPAAGIAPLRYILYFFAVSGLPAGFLLKNFLLKKKSGERLAVLIVRLKSTTMVILSICESVAIYGVILYFIGGSRKDFYILAAYSLFLFAAFFPRRHDWHAYTAGAAE